MKRLYRNVFGMMIVAVGLLLARNCYAYEGESEEEWVNRMWYNTSWTIVKTRPKDTDLMGGVLTFHQLFENYVSYADVNPASECGRIYIRMDWAIGYIEIVDGKYATLYDKQYNKWCGFSWQNMEADTNQ